MKKTKEITEFYTRNSITGCLQKFILENDSVVKGTTLRQILSRKKILGGANFSKVEDDYNFQSPC